MNGHHSGAPEAQVFRRIEEIHVGPIIYRIGSADANNGPTATEVGEAARLGLPCPRRDEHHAAVKSIMEHQPMGPGDIWFYDVLFEDDTCHRIFNMTKLVIGKPQRIMPVTNKLIT